MEILEIFKNLVAGKHAHDDLKKVTAVGIEYLDKAKAWLDDLEKNGDHEKIANILNEVTENVHKNMAEKFRSGELGPELMEQMHRLALMFPSPLADSFEKLLQSFYDKYHK